MSVEGITSMNPITKKVAETFKKEVQTVFQRPRGFFKCPLSTEDFVEAQHSFVPPAVQEAFKALVAYPYFATYHVMDNTMALHLFPTGSISGEPVHKIFVHVGDKSPFYKLNGDGHSVRLPLTGAARIFGDDKTANTVQWCRDLLEYNDRAKEAMETLNKLLPTDKPDKDKDKDRVAYTPPPEAKAGATSFGQIYRILPELLPCFPADAQKEVAHMKKASRLPQGTNQEVQARIERLSELFMRCQLMPPVDFVTDQKNPLGFSTWGNIYPYRGWSPHEL